MINKDFNSPEFGGIMNDAGTNRFYMSVKQWINKTSAIGLTAKTGRYGGTYAHKDIAFNFGLYISPMFNLLLIKEFQRLKEEENKYLKSPEWLHRRFLVKANYTLQTDAIKKFIIPKTTLPTDKHGIIYASEAELINFAVLGYTAKEWSNSNPQLILKGENLRDNLSNVELIVLDNMQTINSHLIAQSISQSDRLEIIKTESKRQMQTLSKSNTIAKIENDELSSLNKSLKQALDYNPKEKK